MTPSDVPAAFGDFFAGLEEQRLAPLTTDYFHQCFGCGPSHPSGLRVRCFRTDDGVVSPVMIAKHYTGPPGGAHGGIVAAYLDEICASAVARATGKVAVTGELTVRYVAPVPVETAVVGHGWLVAEYEKYVDVEARLEEFATRTLLATARGRFFPVG